MCETCELVTKMYSAILRYNPDLATALGNMISDTSHLLNKPDRNNVPYHKFIGSTPTEGMPHFSMPIIENAIKDFFTQNNLRLD